jgi:hypothetical protein
MPGTLDAGHGRGARRVEPRAIRHVARVDRCSASPPWFKGGRRSSTRPAGRPRGREPAGDGVTTRRPEEPYALPTRTRARMASTTVLSSPRHRKSTTGRPSSTVSEIIFLPLDPGAGAARGRDGVGRTSVCASRGLRPGPRRGDRAERVLPFSSDGVHAGVHGRLCRPRPPRVVLLCFVPLRKAATSRRRRPDSFATAGAAASR